MSHLLSGRNRPSLDFILKIIDFFPDVDLYWILNGSGVFPKNSEIIEKENSVVSNFAPPTPIYLFSQIPSPAEIEINSKKSNQIEALIKNENAEEIEKIVFFYKNGTFKTYSPN
jgi:hypothetical protein